jgi:hypothetical protein
LVRYAGATDGRTSTVLAGQLITERPSRRESMDSVGHVALITGAARGLGVDVARQLANADARGTRLSRAVLVFLRCPSRTPVSRDSGT